MTSWVYRPNIYMLHPLHTDLFSSYITGNCKIYITREIIDFDKGTCSWIWCKCYLQGLAQLWENYKIFTQPTGFEPVRAEPNGFRVHRLNHSATTAVPSTVWAKVVEVEEKLFAAIKVFHTVSFWTRCTHYLLLDAWSDNVSHTLELKAHQHTRTWLDSISTMTKHAQSAGFEPARAEPNGFLVHRLNHSATTAVE